MIELLVVATIMIVLTTIGLVSYQQVSKKARDGKRRADLETVSQALVLYRSDTGAYPATLDWSDMSPIQNYIKSTQVSDPKPLPYPQYEYTYDSVGRSFDLCATYETTTPAEQCTSSP